MRKLLLITMVMLSLQGFSQKYRISSFYAEDGWQTWDYKYSDATGTRLLNISEIDLLTKMEIEDSLFYDDKGNITKLSTWQKIYDTIDNEVYEEWINACYVEYTYNEQNLRATRKNYNNFGSWELGGIYTYYYDEDGKMTSWTMAFLGLDEYQKGIIEYNEEGLKESETIQQYSKETYYLENSFLIECSYDDNGNLAREVESYWAEGEWVPQLIRSKEYDEYNNCIIEEVSTAGGNIQERTIYTYDPSISIENVYHYENPEDDYPMLPQMKSMVKSYEYYAENDSGELAYVTDFIFDYEVYDADAVEEVTFSASIYPNPAQDFVMIESEANYVEVVDVYGRVVYATEMTDMLKVDMSNYPTGVYFVRLHNDGEMSVQKIMKD